MADYQKEYALKFISLGLLIPQSIFYTILAALARRPDSGGNVFFGPSAVVCMEIGKLIVSISATFFRVATSNPDGGSPIVVDDNKHTEHGRHSPNQIDTEKIDCSREPLLDADERMYDQQSSSGNRLYTIILDVKSELVNAQGFRLVPPAVLYVIQNNLQVYACEYLTPAEYQVVCQTRLAFTAIFSIVILRKSLNYKHWLSILILAIGTMTVQLVSSLQIKDNKTINVDFRVGNTRTQSNLLLGTIATVGASACSGLAGVLVELLLKRKLHFWTTNVFLSFFSIIPAALPVIADSIYRSTFDPLRFFNGYVWSLVLMNIVGGIIASLTMKYADNILKNFAVSASLIGTIYLSALIIGSSITSLQVLGTALVICSIGVYARA